VEVGGAQHFNADQEQNRHQVSRVAQNFQLLKYRVEKLFCTSNGPNEEGMKQSAINWLCFVSRILPFTLSEMFGYVIGTS